MQLNCKKMPLRFAKCFQYSLLYNIYLSYKLWKLVRLVS